MATEVRTAPMLSHFFAFNPTFGPTDETEQDKLLFYYPADLQMDHKLKNIGLSEALVNFTRTFSPDRPCEVVHTTKRRMIFYNPEPNYWMVMFIDQGSVSRMGKDNREVVEYLDHELLDSILDTVIRQVYRMFKLFHNTYDSIAKKHGRQTLVHKLDEFLPPVLARMDLTDIDLLTSLDGIQFLPLDKTLYLRVQSFINATESSFSDVAFTCFLFSQHLVFSGLEQDDMRTLYRYIASGFLSNLPFNTKTPEEMIAAKRKNLRDAPPARNQDDRNQAALVLVAKMGLGGTSKPGFLTGPEDVTDPQTPINIPRVHVGPESQPHYMIIYQYQDIKVLFFIPVTPTTEANAMDLGYYQAMHFFLSPRLQDLAARIAQLQNRRPLAESPYKYIYFNGMNMALKTTMQEARPSQLSREVMRLLSEMNDEFNKSPEQFGEIVVKTAGDYWVVGKRSEQREFYAVFFKKDATILDIHGYHAALAFPEDQGVAMCGQA